ncbi:MAG: hypothetical protein ABI970_26965 [Chloroflexota bacterium]
MPPQIGTILTLISGISWSLVYIELIRRGFKDKTYGMPLFALTFNLAWEFLFSLVFRNNGDVTLQTIINFIWGCFDIVIAYTYFRYGREEFSQHADAKWFAAWSVAAFAVSFAIIYFSAVEFGANWAPIYTAFAQNLMMSVLFIGMLTKRNDVGGQSIYIALFKWLGTAAPTVLFYASTGSKLVLILGAGCFIYDALYTFLLYRKFHALGLNPFTRRPITMDKVITATGLPK